MISCLKEWAHMLQNGLKTMYTDFIFKWFLAFVIVSHVRAFLCFSNVCDVKCPQSSLRVKMSF